MVSSHRQESHKFGDVIATVFVGSNPIHVHSNDTTDDDEHQFHEWNHVREHFYGLKWECVEFARRYLHVASGYLLPFVENARDLWDILPRESRCIASSICGPVRKGSVLIFDDKGPYEGTGHVAIAISDSTMYLIDIAEQNMDPTGIRTIDVTKEDYLLGWFDFASPLKI